MNQFVRNIPLSIERSLSVANADYLVSDEVLYPISINGKKRDEITFPAGTNPKEIEATVVDLDVVKKWLDGGNIKKVIVVPDRMINVVI